MSTAIVMATAAAVADAGRGRRRAQRYYRRFEPIERVMHAFLMLTFVGCALTGLPLLFSDRGWAADAGACLRRLRERRR